MKKTNILTIAVLTLTLLLSANLATALEPIPKESGFGGFIRPGVSYLNYKSNMVASFMGFDLSEGTIHSLDDSPNSQSTGIVMVPFSLAYTFASTRTQLFLGTDLTDLIRFDYAQQFGVKQEIGKLGILQGGTAGGSRCHRYKHKGESEHETFFKIHFAHRCRAYSVAMLGGYYQAECQDSS